MNEPPAHRRTSGLTEAFFQTAGEAKRLIVFQHIQKTAGTSLRQVIRANLPPAEQRAVRLTKERSSRTKLLGWYAEFLDGLSAQDRLRLCCVMSHTAAYLAPALDEPALFMTMVREPVDRVLSQYHFSTRDPAKAPPGGLSGLYSKWSGRVPREENVAKLASRLFNWQSRMLLGPYHDTSSLPYTSEPSDDAEEWRERVSGMVERYELMGVQDRFAEFTELLERRLGWRPIVAREKVNSGRPRLGQVNPALRDQIAAHNWLDSYLYELCSARFESTVNATGGGV